MDEHEVTESGSHERPVDPTQEHDSADSSSVPPEHEGQQEQDSDQDADPSASPGGSTYGRLLAPEELPTMQWLDIDAEMAAFEERQQDSHRQESGQEQRKAPAGPLEGLEDAMAWLEQLAAGQGVPIDEMPTLVTAERAKERDSTADSEEPVEPGTSEESLAQLLEMDSDPMAWLEQLAVDQSSPLEELPSVADRLLASDIVSHNEIAPDSTINNPIDVDQALTYLEQLAVAQGIDLDAVNIEEPRQSVKSLEDALAILDRLSLVGLATRATNQQAMPAAEESQREPSEPVSDLVVQLEKEELYDLSSTMPDDPELALRWLSELDVMSGQMGGDKAGRKEGSVPRDEIEEHPVDVASDAGRLEGRDHARTDGDVDALEYTPHDPDEAVAWMASLAARGGAREREEAATLVTDEETEKESANVPSTREARRALRDGDMARAVSLYQELIAESSMGDALIEDLQEAINDHGATPQILRLLGDAYMQVGEVDKAVETYRKGFDQL